MDSWTVILSSTSYSPTTLKHTIRSKSYASLYLQYMLQLWSPINTRCSQLTVTKIVPNLVLCRIISTSVSLLAPVGIYVPCSLGRLVVVFSSLSFSSRPVSCSISVSFLLYQHDRSLLPNPTFYSVAVSFYLFCFCLIVPSLVVNIIVLASCARRVHGHSVESWSKFFVYCPVSIYYHMLPALIVVGKQEKNGIIQRQPTTHVVSLSLQVTHAP